MATHDYRSITTFPAVRTFKPSNTFDVIEIPSQVSRIQVGSSAASFVSTDKSDNDAITAIDNFASVPANNLLTIHLGRGSSRNSQIQVALTSASSTTEVTIILEEM